MKIFISRFSMAICLILGTLSLDAQVWDGSTGTTGNIYRSGRVGIGVDLPAQMLHTSGNLRTDGKYIFFGDKMTLQGNGASAFVLRSNHSTVSQLLFRNDANINVGRIASTGSGAYFGLKDADNKWTYLGYNGVYSQIRVASVPILTARLYNPGEVDQLTRVGINTTNPSRDLHVVGDGRMDHLYINTNSDGGFDTEEYFVFVDGKAAFEEVRVQLSQHWGDFVFEEEYKPMPLEQLKKYVYTNKHLPNMPKGALLEEEGMELSDIVGKQMVNIEELVLYTIEQEEKLKDLEQQLLDQQKEIDAIKAALLKKE